MDARPSSKTSLPATSREAVTDRNVRLVRPIHGRMRERTAKNEIRSLERVVQHVEVATSQDEEKSSNERDASGTRVLPLPKISLH